MKNNHRVRTKPRRTFDFAAAMKRMAELYMEAERFLTPLIRFHQTGPHQAVILIAIYGDGLISGKRADQGEHSMTEKDIAVACNTLVALWQLGLFVPGPAYPYSLEETLKAGEA